MLVSTDAITPERHTQIDTCDRSHVLTSWLLLDQLDHHGEPCGDALLRAVNLRVSDGLVFPSCDCSLPCVQVDVSLKSCLRSQISDLTSTGLGKHHTSPKKACSKRNSRIVIPLGNSTKHRQLLQKLAHLRGMVTTKHAPTVLDVHPSDITDQPMEAPTVATPCLSNNSTVKQFAGASLRLHTS
jgi:hypothetical protein